MVQKTISITEDAFKHLHKIWKNPDENRTKQEIVSSAILKIKRD